MHARSVLRTCLVSFADSSGVKHQAEVQAESLYEAAVKGVKAISEAWAEQPQLGTPITVAVKPIEHTLTMIQIRAWLDRGAGSPKEMALKSDLKALLVDCPSHCVAAIRRLASL